MTITGTVDRLGDGRTVLEALDRVQTPGDLVHRLRLPEREVISVLEQLRLLGLVESTADLRRYGRTKKGEEVCYERKGAKKKE